MAKPIVTEHGFKPGGFYAADVQEIIVAAWCPTPDGSGSPTQVHVQLKLKGLSTPMVMRFKSPDSLNEVIKQLQRYRDQVWPGANNV